MESICDLTYYFLSIYFFNQISFVTNSKPKCHMCKFQQHGRINLKMQTILQVSCTLQRMKVKKGVPQFLTSISKRLPRSYTHIYKYIYVYIIHIVYDLERLPLVSETLDTLKPGNTYILFLVVVLFYLLIHQLGQPVKNVLYFSTRIVIY